MKSLNHIRLLSSALVLGFAVIAGAPAFAQSSDMPRSMDKKAMNMDMADDCQAMMKKQEKRMAETKAEDAALTAKVTAMNNAPENQKPALLAAIVTQLVENRTASHARMSEMQSEMMPHMMEHMAQGSDSMATCPMMHGKSGMSGMKNKAPGQQQKNR